MIKDMDKLREYAGNATPLVEAQGGPVLTRVQMTEFPDADSVRKWYRSDDYQALVPMREQAAEMTFIVADDLPQ